MPLAPFTLAEALRAMGVAEVFIGDPLVAPSDPTGMKSLGATEGAITFAAPQVLNNLTAPELTGEVPHQSTTTLGAVTITAPVIFGDPLLWARLSPTSTASGGISRPVKVTETSVLLIPREEVGGGLEYAVGGWTRTAGNGVAAAGPGPAAAPKNAVWLWRATITMGEVPYAYPNGGKVIVTVTFTGMFDGTKPEGHKVYTIGDPRAAVNYETQAAAPIAVLPAAA